MSFQNAKVRLREGGLLSFFCPGCQTTHSIRHDAGGGPAWLWNGDMDRPTFHPSVLVRSGHYVHEHDPRSCWCTYNSAHPEEDDPDFRCGQCHSFVTDGHIQFLSDCSHALAGQTVPLPDFPVSAE